MADVAIDQFGHSNIAAPWWYGGCSVIPIATDGTKSPLVRWKPYQETGADLDTVKNWFEIQWPRAGVAIICGRVSGNIEMLELEGRANSDETILRISHECAEAGIGDTWTKITGEGYTEITPSGGLHLIYRVADQPVPNNTKLATRPARDEELTSEEQERRERDQNCSIIRVLAETRGEGGYVIVAPTPGHCHPTGHSWDRLTGSPSSLVSISWADRNILHAIVRNVLHVPDPREQQLAIIPPRPTVQRDPGAPLTPVEDFNARSSWHDSWFTENGWRIHHQDGEEIFWVRPGKDWGDGHSATTGVREGEQDCLYVWSTSTGLPVETPLTKFMVYAYYKHGGNRSNAARFLRTQGYGAPLVAPSIPLTEVDLEFRGEDEVPATLMPHSLENLLHDYTGGVAMTDDGYAERVCDRFGDRIRYVKLEKQWYVWHSEAGIWAEDEQSNADRIILAEARSTYDWVKQMVQANPDRDKELKSVLKYSQNGLNNARLNALTEVVRKREGIAISHDDFDVNLDLLNLQNGTLNLNTFELKPHDSANLLTMCFNAAYDPYAECPNFLKYLDDVFPDPDVRSYIQRAIGYSLLGRPSDRAMFILHGPSGTGKSVFTSVMTELFGTYGATAPSSTFKIKQQDTTFDLHSLRGRRFISGSELPAHLEMNEELVKRMTGDGDKVKSRDLFQKFSEWKPRCVIWLATNHLPRLSSDDDAIWRRIRTVPMTTIVKDMKDEIGGFSDILIQEADGLLNWALDGLRQYHRVGLSEPEAVLKDLIDYHNEVDSVASWLNYVLTDGLYEIVEGGDKRTSAASIFADYEEYCRELGTKPFGTRRFIKRLEGVRSSIKTARSGGRLWVHNLSQVKGIHP